MFDFDTTYAALMRRDPALDGHVFVGVRTTRIYCRPVCPARTPKPQNVTFHASAAHAQAAGYRPCLRCRPETAPDSPAWQGSVASVTRALRLIEEGALAEADAEALAGRLGMTSRHLRRLFVQHLGVTPAAVESARRVHLAKALIQDTRLPMTSIAHAAGYGSLRRFNEAFLSLFGGPPTALRREDLRPDVEAEERLRLRLAYRPPLDWRARLEPSLQDPVHEAEALCGVLLLDGAVVRLHLTQGAGPTVLAEVRDAPLRSLTRVVARLRRELRAA